MRKARSGGQSLLTVIAEVSAKHGNVVEVRGRGRGVSPAFGKRRRSGFANQGQPYSSVDPEYIEIQIDVGRIGGVMHRPRDE